MSDSIVLFVRRGSVRRYEALKEKSRGLQVEVAWDRREGPRRKAQVSPVAERRRSDRRQSSSTTWEMADFSVGVGRK
jgi:hypothetical protein